VVRRLGAGGMGAVYLAVGKDDRQVAIKVIHSEYAADPMFRAWFRREIEAARRVRRFCTAPIIDADPDANPPYLVTEFVKGPDLRGLVGADGPLRGADLEALAVGVVAALTAIHDAGVVHRDLKPANVLLSPFGPRVIDFGIARVVDQTRLTADGAMLGTPAFMAPEQVRGEPVTTAADVFAWGALVAFAARGEAPFTGESTAAMLHQILTGEPHLDSLDGPLCEQVQAAMVKSPESRPTAKAILQNLISGGASVAAEVLDAAPVSLPPEGTGKARPGQPSGNNESETGQRRAAEAGNTDAMLELGKRLRASKRFGEAERWYREAAELDDIKAMVELGLILRRRKEYAEAERWYRKAADGGSASGMNNLGLIYHNRGEHEEAERCYRKAIDAGMIAAMANLGALCDKRGQFDQAEHWYRQGADAGFAAAMERLGTMYYHRGQLDKAEHWYRKGADAGDAEAKKYLVIVLRKRAEECR
jgi:TPR repeat protein